MRGATRLPIVAALPAAVLLAACAATQAYREPGGRFSMERPAGWSVTTAEAAGVAHWRFTPEPLADPAGEAPREIDVAIIPLPPEAALTSASLEEVAEYVRDATIETTRESGGRYTAGPPRTGTIGGHASCRFDLVGIDAGGVEQRLSLIVVRRPGAAVVVSFGAPAAEAEEVLPVLERCAASLRFPGS
jgi:hypothetical protein